MFKNCLKLYKAHYLCIRKACAAGKVNSGDDTQKAYRDINNIDGIFALSARKYHYIAINGRQIYEYDTKARKRTGNNEIKVRSIIDCKQASNK